MADKIFPPLNFDTSLDLVLLVLRANTLRDLGLAGWWVYGHCSVHGDRQEPVFEDIQEI